MAALVAAGAMWYAYNAARGEPTSPPGIPAPAPDIADPIAGFNQTQVARAIEAERGKTAYPRYPGRGLPTSMKQFAFSAWTPEQLDALDRHQLTAKYVWETYDPREPYFGDTSSASHTIIRRPTYLGRLHEEGRAGDI